MFKGMTQWTCGVLTPYHTYILWKKRYL